MPSNVPRIHRFTAMTVPCEVQLFGSSKASQITRLIEENTHRLESKFNFYSEDSFLNEAINRRTSHRVALDEESLKVFQTLEGLVKGTDGVFDPTVGTVKWLSKLNSGLSRDEAYQLAQPAMGISSWQVNRGCLEIKDAMTRFDLGGVIKEFAIDQAINLAHALGAKGALVNFGGDIRTFGEKSDASAFNVAVLNPKNPSEPYFSLPLVDAALTTSAHYERKTEFADQTTSHILAPQGTHSNVLSVTVVAPTALEAGAISTALTINPLLSVPQEVGVVFIDDQLAIHQDTDFLTQ